MVEAEVSQKDVELSIPSDVVSLEIDAKTPEEIANQAALDAITPWTRWIIALAAVGVHLSIGSVYAWSVFVKPLEEKFDWNKPFITVTFSVAIVVLGGSAAFGGRWMEKNGPDKSAAIAALFFGCGVMLASLGVYLEQVWILWITYGVLGGVGLGNGYIAPVSTLIKWFPDRRGLATGLAVFGFGGASMIAGPVQTLLIEHVGIGETFLIMGGIYGTVIFICSRALRFPPKGYVPAGYDPSSKVVAANMKGFRTTANFTIQRALHSSRFWLIWSLFFINISAGIMLISLAAPMAEDTIGLTSDEAGVMVGLMGIFNGAGRLLWSAASDYIGRVYTYTGMFVLQIVLFFVLANTTSRFLYQGCIFIILTCYGGGFSMCPAFLADMFGSQSVGAIHGVILTAWSAAGIVGPQLGAIIKDSTDSYEASLYTVIGLLVVAILCTLKIMHILHKKKRHLARIKAVTTIKMFVLRWRTRRLARLAREQRKKEEEEQEAEAPAEETESNPPPVEDQNPPSVQEEE